MDLGLRGRVIVVTGASSGIGLATCRLLVEEGADVVACARREDVLRSALSNLPSKQVLAVPGNVNEASDMDFVIDSASDRFGRIDGVACIAGHGIHGRVLNLTAAQWDQELSQKISAITNVVRAARPHLTKDGGRVVTITAPTGRDPDPSMAAVSAGRAAIANLTRSLALDLAGEGIGVNAVSVGLIDTPRQRARYESAQTPLPYEQWIAEEAVARGVPLKRPGTSNEVAALITLALCPVLSYTTGSTISAAGGLATG